MNLIKPGLNKNAMQPSFKCRLQVAEGALSKSLKKSPQYNLFKSYVAKMEPNTDVVKLSQDSEGLTMSYKNFPTVQEGRKNPLKRLLAQLKYFYKEGSSNKCSAIEPTPHGHRVIDTYRSVSEKFNTCMGKPYTGERDWLGSPIN